MSINGRAPSRFALWVVCAIGLLLFLFATMRSNRTPSQVTGGENTAAGPSVAVPGYGVVQSKQTGFGAKWAYAVISGTPSDAELKALGSDLRTKYPDTRFNVCNPMDGLPSIDSHLSDFNAPFDETWEQTHCLAMLNIFPGSGWQMVGSAAGGREDGRVIASF